MIKQLRKKFELFALSIFSLTGVGAFKPIIIPTGSLNSFAMSPLGDPGTLSYGSYSFLTESIFDATVVISIKNDRYPNGVQIFSKTEKPSIFTVNFTYDNRYNRSLNTIFIEVTTQGITSTYSHAINYADYGYHTINDSTKSFKSQSTGILFNGLEWKTFTSTYTFNGFNSVLYPTYYHELPLTGLVVKSSDLNLMNAFTGEVSLQITNRNGIFDGFEHDDSIANIPLKCSILANAMTLSFKNSMYVEPHCLKMSSTPKTGYVETTHLYLPRNEMQYQGEYKITIVFTNFGLDKATYVCSMKLNALVNTLGDCYNSEYCIINSEDTGNKNKGQII